MKSAAPKSPTSLCLSGIHAIITDMQQSWPSGKKGNINEKSGKKTIFQVKFTTSLISYQERIHLIKKRN